MLVFGGVCEVCFFSKSKDKTHPLGFKNSMNQLKVSLPFGYMEVHRHSETHRLCSTKPKPMEVEPNRFFV